ncbi:MAG: SGNH/GDSL hydrolase family protein [Bacillota bacterium]|nr:SGNH/GDSL hydrolase family protein [Bacillota bacterium]
MNYNKSNENSSIFIKVFTVILIIATIGVVDFGHIRNNKIIQQNKAAAEQIKKQQNIETKPQDSIITSSLKYEGKNWLAIGDGITSANQYQNMVAKVCKINKVTTDAVPSQKLGMMADRLTKESLSDIDLITIFGGTNDYGNDKLLGTKDDDKTVDKFYGNIRKVIDKIQSLNPKAKIVFITPLKRGRVGNQPVYPAANNAGNTLDQYVQAIKYVCGQNSIQVIDLFNNSGINENNLSQYTTDNLTPNAAGYDKISKVIADELENPK